MAASEDALRHMLLDPVYWRPRLERLDDEPHQLVQIPRSELSRPGIEVIELRLRSHDGLPLRALMARSEYHRAGGQVQLRNCADLATCAIDWGAVERGTCDLVFCYPAEHRLENRVLDVLRVIKAASSLEGVDEAQVALYSGCQAPPDEFTIADLVRSHCWN